MKKWLSVTLVMVMLCVSILPAGAWAEEAYSASFEASVEAATDAGDTGLTVEDPFAGEANGKVDDTVDDLPPIAPTEETEPTPSVPAALPQGETPPQNVEAEPAQPTGIRFGMPSVTIGKKEVFYGLKAEVLDAAGNPLDGVALTWSSSNVKIAKVDASGTITGVKKGSTYITATAPGGVSASVRVEVKKTPSRATLAPASMKLGEGMNGVLKPGVNSGAASGSFTFISDRPDVVSVDGDGIVTALKKGSATITVKTFNGKTDTCEVEVLGAPASIEPESDALKLCEEMSQVLKVTVRDIDGDVTAASCSFKVVDAGTDPCVSVDASTGRLTALKKGSAVIEITAHNGITAHCSVEVVSAPADMTLSPSTLSLGVKETFYGLSCALVPKAGEESCAAEIAWKSSNTRVVSVNTGTGAITGLKKGTATVTATTHNGISRSVKVTVMKAPSKVTFSPATVKLGEGMSARLQPEFNKGATAVGLRWSSDNPAVAAVDESGVVTGLAGGSAVITATCFNGKKGTCKVTVLGLPASVALAEDTIDVAIGQSAAIYAVVRDASGAETETAFTCAVEPDSPNPGCVSVDDQGKISALERGSAVVRVSSHNGVSALCTVNVVDAPESIQLNKTAISIGLKEVYRGLSVSLTPPAGAERCSAVIRWESSNPKVAKVDAKTGVITGLKKGDALITAASHNGKTATVRVTVKKAPKQVKLSPSNVELSVGMTRTLTASFNSGAAAGGLSFTSSNIAVAIVDADGVVRAVGKGTAVITARSFNDRIAQCTVTVQGEAMAIELDADRLNLIVGLTGRLTAAVVDDQGEKAPGDISFGIDPGSENPNCITVNGSGTVTAIAPGSAVVRAQSHNGLTATCAVTVVAAPAALKLDVSEITLGAGERFPGLKVGLTPPEGEKACDAELTWSSSDANVAAVNADGSVTAKGVGAATVTVKSHNGLEAGYTVNVKAAPAAVTLSPDSLGMAPGMTRALDAAFDAGAASRTLTFESSDPAVATVDAWGNVTARAVGEATVTVTTYNGVTGQCAVHVGKEADQVFLPEKLDVAVGMTLTPSPTCLDADGNETWADYSYTILDGTGSANVDDAGRVVGIRPGQATLRVTTHNGVSTHLSGGARVNTECVLNIVEAPARITLPESVEIDIGETFTLAPVMYTAGGAVTTVGDYAVTLTGDSVSIDKGGVVTGLKIGYSTVRVETYNGLSATCQVLVTHPRYRLFAAYSYFDQSIKGGLYFPQNNAYSVRNALERSEIDGVSYEVVGMMKNPAKIKLLTAIDTAFADSIYTDVNVVYLCSHGFNYIDVDNDTYRMFHGSDAPTHYGLQLPGYTDWDSPSKYYITAEEIYNAISGIRGKVILVLDSCFSGEFISNMGSALASENGRITVMAAASNTKASYYDIKDTNSSFDFFTYYLLQGAGYDMQYHTESVLMRADQNSDGALTVNELFNYAKKEVTGNLPTFKGKSWFHGNTAQTPRIYEGANGDLVLFMLPGAITG